MGDEKLRYKLGVDKQRSTNEAWYRGPHCNWYPSQFNLAEEQWDQYFVRGWTPEKPFINKKTRITAFGSCFARNIAVHLHKRGFTVNNDVNTKHRLRDTHVITCSDAMVNTYSILQQFEWALENKAFEQNLWYDREGRLAKSDEPIRLSTKKVFDRTDVFIITIGLSEAWYNKQTGNVFWRAVPKRIFNPEKHAFKVIEYEENSNNLIKTTQLIHNRYPNVKVIMTLSPVPLLATFRPNSCIVSDCVSKSILRAAIDNVMRNHHWEGLYYFPSFEIIKYGLENPYVPDNRHVKAEVLSRVYPVFDKYYTKE